MKGMQHLLFTSSSPAYENNTCFIFLRHVETQLFLMQLTRIVELLSFGISSERKDLKKKFLLLPGVERRKMHENSPCTQ